MTAMEVERLAIADVHERPKRQTSDYRRMIFGANTNVLELEAIVDLLKGCGDCTGGVNCKICGKLYKSKVCYTKHLWEHSIYWDLFEGVKNHDRVLSIQAALILYSGQCGGCSSEDSLAYLLVTTPHYSDKKKPKDIDVNDLHPTEPTNDIRNISPAKRKSPNKCDSPPKRSCMRHPWSKPESPLPRRE